MPSDPRDWAFSDYKAAVLVRERDFPAERSGQCHFNQLALVRPGLASLVVETDLDPFYADQRLPAFLEFVERRWWPKSKPVEGSHADEEGHVESS